MSEHSASRASVAPAVFLAVAVAVATRIQILLEDAVVQAQRLEGRCAEQATIGGMLG